MIRFERIEDLVGRVNLTMSKFLYCFGYQTPNQARLSARSLWIDDEDSQQLFIEAASPESALAWGEQVSEQFIKLLFRNENVSWREMDFARWIDDGATWSEHDPFVVAGDYPKFDQWLARYGPSDL